jgi:protease-4
MTPETREVLNQVLDQYFGDLVTTIGTARKKQPDEVRAIIDKGPFTADQARSNGLVDTLAFDDQVSGELTKRLGQSELKLLPDKTYAKIPADSVGAAGGKRIALVVGEGDITRSTSSNGPTSDEGIASAAFLKLLRDVENDSSIKGAILRIDSPGGDGIASDDILHEARNLSKKKPVVISMGDLAASGGYFISMTGDPIVAYPNTLTGSIGVIFAKMNVHGLYDKLGIHEDILNRGRYAGLYSAYEPMNDDERQKIQNEVEDFYGQFKNRVVEGRKLPAGRVEELAQGRVWLGVQAKQNGLVDQLGGLDKAIELVKQKAQIPASEKITLVPFPPKRTIFEMLVNRTDENAVLDSKIREILGGLPVKTWLRGGFLKIMPYTITVR